MTSGYRETVAPGGTPRLLACVWEQRPPGPYPQRIIPDGCVDLIWLSERRLVFAGADTASRVEPLVGGRLSTGVRLLPGAAGSVLGVPASELCDRQVDAVDVWGGRASELADRLGLAAPRDRIALLVSAVTCGRPAVDPLVAELVRCVDRRTTSVAQIADELGVSERSLQRRTRRAVGYGPKMLGRILRLRRLSGLPDGESLASRAWDAGYASQSHMNEEVRRLTGMTPVGFLKDARAPSP